MSTANNWRDQKAIFSLTTNFSRTLSSLVRRLRVFPAPINCVKQRRRFYFPTTCDFSRLSLPCVSIRTKNDDDVADVPADLKYTWQYSYPYFVPYKFPLMFSCANSSTNLYPSIFENDCMKTTISSTGLPTGSHSQGSQLAHSQKLVFSTKRSLK